MIKKTADGVEIVKGMEVWISPFFEADDGAIKFGKLKTYMDKYIVSSMRDSINDRVNLKREECKSGRWVFDTKALYADKNKAFKKRIDILQEIISEKRDNLNEEIEKANKEIDAIQDLKNDLDRKISVRK